MGQPGPPFGVSTAQHPLVLVGYEHSSRIRSQHGARQESSILGKLPRDEYKAVLRGLTG